jgi:transposase
MPIRAIARHLGISKNTVERALANDRPPKYERPAKGSVVDAVEVQIRELLEETSTMPATVIAERIGWERGMTVLKERGRELRPAYVPVDPVSRTTYQPGELLMSTRPAYAVPPRRGGPALWMVRSGSCARAAPQAPLRKAIAVHPSPAYGLPNIIL